MANTRPKGMKLLLAKEPKACRGVRLLLPDELAAAAAVAASGWSERRGWRRCLGIGCRAAAALLTLPSGLTACHRLSAVRNLAELGGACRLALAALAVICMSVWVGSGIAARPPAM
jgi:hypothetical protein